MKIVASIIFSFFIVQNSYSASLTCNFIESGSITDSFSSSISIKDKPETFKFIKSLNGKNYKASVNWDTNAAAVEIKYKSLPISIENSIYWDFEKPFELSFREKMGEAAVNCQIDSNDGFNHPWILFDSQLKIHARITLETLNAIKRVSSDPDAEFGQLLSKNKKICNLLGSVKSGYSLSNIYLKLVQLDGKAFSRKLFPKVPELFDSLLYEFSNLSKYCESGESINFEKLRSDVTQLETLISSVPTYLNSKFPNDGTFP